MVGPLHYFALESRFLVSCSSVWVVFTVVDVALVGRTKLRTFRHFKDRRITLKVPEAPQVRRLNFLDVGCLFSWLYLTPSHKSIEFGSSCF